MMRFCSNIEFVLSERDRKIVKQINELYPTNDLHMGQNSSEVELLKLSWLFLLRQVYNDNRKVAPFISYQGAEVDQYLKHLFGASTFKTIKFSSHSWFRVSRAKVLCEIIGAISVSLTNLGDCISCFLKHCFVLCVIGQTPLGHMINLMTGNHVTSSGEVNLRVMCESDCGMVIIDWSGCEKQSELKSLAFAANVANYTICSTKPSTL